MARAIDATGVQFRMLNTKKGPAVQALRAQADKQRYRAYMKNAVESQAGLDLKQGMVQRLLMKDGAIAGLQDQFGDAWERGRVVLTPGTFARSSPLRRQRAEGGARARVRRTSSRNNSSPSASPSGHEDGDAAPAGREIH